MILKKPKPGLIFQILCTDDGVWFGKYLTDHPLQGPLIQISFSKSGELADAEAVFAPVVCGILPPLRSGRWKIVGQSNCVVEQLPLFVLDNSLRPPTWFLVDGEKEILLGETLPERYRQLEVLMTWSAELLEERLRTGRNRFGVDAILGP